MTQGSNHTGSEAAPLAEQTPGLTGAHGPGGGAELPHAGNGTNIPSLAEVVAEVRHLQDEVNTLKIELARRRTESDDEDTPAKKKSRKDKDKSIDMIKVRQRTGQASKIATYESSLAQALVHEIMPALIGLADVRKGKYFGLLPAPLEDGEAPRSNGDDVRLWNPRWLNPPSHPYNVDFIKAVCSQIIDNQAVSHMPFMLFHNRLLKLAPLTGRHAADHSARAPYRGNHPASCHAVLLESAEDLQGADRPGAGCRRCKGPTQEQTAQQEETREYCMLDTLKSTLTFCYPS